MYVYFYLLVRAALRSLDGSLLEAAASLGAGRWRTLRLVVFPQLRPALGGAALLTFMTALASFSAPYIFGGGFRVMPTQIVATRLNGDDRLAMVETMSLTLLALVALWLFRGARTADAGGGRKGTAPTPPVRHPAPALPWAAAGWGWRRCCLPHLTLLLVSPCR
jgi:iron(III) transport system permease protein